MTCANLWAVSEEESFVGLFLKQRRTFSFHFAIAYFNAAVVGE